MPQQVAAIVAAMVAATIALCVHHVEEISFMRLFIVFLISVV